MHIGLSKTVWIGAILVFAPASVFMCWYAWPQTRTTRPVYFPVSLTLGEVRSSDFKTNLSGQYTLTVEAKKTIPFETLNCLLGVSTFTERKCDHVSVVRTEWILVDGGKVIQQGTSDTDDAGSWSQETIERELGTFPLQSGHSYTLHIQSLADGRSLAPTDPHLKIEIHPDYYEGNAFLGYFLFTWCKRILFVGCAILAFSGLRWTWRKRRLRPGHSDVLGASPATRRIRTSGAKARRFFGLLLAN
jgi:hypothetical protein